MIRLLTTATLVVLLLAGCNSLRDEPAPTPEATQIPEPDPTQSTALVTELDTVAPGITVAAIDNRVPDESLPDSADGSDESGC